MAFDGKSLWRLAPFDNFLIFLDFLKGIDYIWIEKRISHINSELERLVNTKNGLLVKLKDASAYKVKLTGVEGTESNLMRSGNTIFSGNATSRKQAISNITKRREDNFKKRFSDFDPYFGDLPWIYKETPFPTESNIDERGSIQDSFGFTSESIKYPFISSIKRWFEKIEYKIKRTLELIEELDREKLYLEELKKTKERSTKNLDYWVNTLESNLKNAEMGQLVIGQVPSETFLGYFGPRPRGDQ